MDKRKSADKLIKLLRRCEKADGQRATPLQTGSCGRQSPRRLPAPLSRRAQYRLQRNPGFLWGPADIDPSAVRPGYPSHAPRMASLMVRSVSFRLLRFHPATSALVFCVEKPRQSKRGGRRFVGSLRPVFQGWVGLHACAEGRAEIVPRRSVAKLLAEFAIVFLDVLVLGELLSAHCIGLGEQRARFIHAAQAGQRVYLTALGKQGLGV